MCCCPIESASGPSRFRIRLQEMEVDEFSSSSSYFIVSIRAIPPRRGLMRRVQFINWFSRKKKQTNKQTNKSLFFCSLILVTFPSANAETNCNKQELMMKAIRLVRLGSLASTLLGLRLKNISFDVMKLWPRTNREIRLLAMPAAYISTCRH